MTNSMGLTLFKICHPLPRGRIGNEGGLTALVHVHVLDRDLLLALVAVLCERLNLSRISPRELGSLREVRLPTFCRLLGQPRRTSGLSPDHSPLKKPRRPAN
jgi:hypothetical protein